MKKFFNLKCLIKENPFGFVRAIIFAATIVVMAVFTYYFSLGAFAVQKDYQIGPQDELKIEVWDHPDLTRQVAVSLTGSFTFPLIGEVKAEGLTTEEVEKEITRRLADGYIVNPQVTVTITAFRSKQVNILGEVQKPGTYPYTKQTTLIEIISMAGGLTENAGQEAYILHGKERNSVGQNGDTGRIRRHSSASADINSSERIDLNNLFQTGQDIYFMLNENDTIYVPRADFFYVIGEVDKPGQYKLEKDITVLKAISRAGGQTKKANLKKIKITRVADGKENEIRASLSDPVFPDDIINVPESFF